MSFLGEPDEKLGGGLTNISIVYNRLGLEIYFLTKVWDLDKAGIDQIVMFPVKVVDHICATCRTLCEARCNRCKLVYYCTSKCQTTHWKAHKPYCQEYLWHKIIIIFFCTSCWGSPSQSLPSLWHPNTRPVSTNCWMFQLMPLKT